MPRPSPLKGLSVALALCCLPACAETPAELSEDETIPESWYCRQAREWYPDWGQWEQEVVTLVNEQRADGASCAGVEYPPAAPLEMDDKLHCAARKHALDMQHQGYISHQSPDGSLPNDRMRRAGYVPTAAGENIAVIGYPLISLPEPAEAVLDATHIRHRPTPSRAVELWMKSKPHCKNIMSDRFEDTGVGFVLAADGAPIFTQAFGRGRY